MVVGARRTGLFQELPRCWVFHAQQFPVCIKNGPPPKGYGANLTQLESTWTSIPVARFRHLVESMPRRIEAAMGWQLNTQKLYLMVGVLSVYFRTMRLE